MKQVVLQDRGCNIGDLFPRAAHQSRSTLGLEFNELSHDWHDVWGKPNGLMAVMLYQILRLPPMSIVNGSQKSGLPLHLLRRDRRFKDQFPPIDVSAFQCLEN